MTEEAKNLKEVTEQKDVEARITEEPIVEVKEEPKEEEKQSRYQEKIDRVIGDKKAAEYELERQREENQKLKEQMEGMKTPAEPDLKVSRETIEAGGKKFFTDAALRSMVDANEISEADAYKHQHTRMEERAADKAYERIKNETEVNKEKQTRQEDAKSVMENYPQFDKSHREFNPEDPLYKEATRIFEQGYYANPKGLSLAIKEAKRILRMTDAHIDNSSNLNAGTNSTAPRKEVKETPIGDDEKDLAIRMYRDVKNPATQRNYTDVEAIAKYRKAMDSRKRRT